MTLVIGFGNPLRCDDGVGQVVIERLEAELQRPSLEMIACHQLLPELAEPISKADRVLFLDAAAGQPPGQIEMREITAVPGDSAGLIHDFTPQTLLSYAQLLYGHAPPAYLVTVNGFSFDYGQELSPQMTAVLPDLLRQVKSLL